LSVPSSTLYQLAGPLFCSVVFIRAKFAFAWHITGAGCWVLDVFLSFVPRYIRRMRQSFSNKLRTLGRRLM
jgi:hypothetical protein